MIRAIGTDNFTGLAKDMLKQVMDAIALGQKVMDSTDDPIIKYKLEELLEKLRDGSRRLIVAAQEAHKVKLRCSCVVLTQRVRTPPIKPREPRWTASTESSTLS